MFTKREIFVNLTKFLVIAISLNLNAVNGHVFDYQPQQIHIAFGGRYFSLN